VESKETGVSSGPGDPVADVDILFVGKKEDMKKKEMRLWRIVGCVVKVVDDVQGSQSISARIKPFAERLAANYVT